MQICYNLTSSDGDVFAEMTLISASLLRRIYPEASIVVLVDEVTEGSLMARGAGILDLADEVKRVETRISDPIGRNRFLKTVMREHVEGDFLYLDGDALPIRRFDEIMALNVDFAGVPNRHRGAPFAHFPPEVVPVYDQLGWKHPVNTYYNGGVLFFADTPQTRNFANEYHLRWKRCVETTGDFRDQPALNSAVEECDLKLQALPIVYNATIDAAPCFAREARIWHFFTRGGAPRTNTLLGYLVSHFIATGEIDWVVVDRSIEEDSPWTGGELAYWSDCERHFVGEQYLKWCCQALQSGDIEAASYFLRECITRKRFSPKTWCLLAWFEFHKWCCKEQERFPARLPAASV